MFSTFGGNPVACVAALSVIRIIKNEQLIEKCETLGKEVKIKFEQIRLKFPAIIKEVRGSGLYFGFEFYHIAHTNVVLYRLFKKHFIISSTEEEVLIFKPPLTFEKKNLDCFLISLEECLFSLTNI